MKRAQKLISLLCNVKKVSFATKVSSLPISVDAHAEQVADRRPLQGEDQRRARAAQGARGRRGLGDLQDAARPSSSPPAKGEKVERPGLRDGVQLPGDRRLGGRREGRDHRRHREGQGRQADGRGRREGRRQEAPGARGRSAATRPRRCSRRRGSRASTRRRSPCSRRSRKHLAFLVRVKEVEVLEEQAGGRRVGGGRARREADIPRRLAGPTRPERSWRRKRRRKA